MIKGFKWGRPFLPERYGDGDTIYGLLDRGEGSLYRPKPGIRLVLGDGGKYDAPEVRKEPERARAATEALMALLPLGVPVPSLSHRLDPDSFGRPLCSIMLADGRDLATVLVEMGHVKWL